MKIGAPEVQRQEGTAGLIPKSKDSFVTLVSNRRLLRRRVLSTFRVLFSC